MASKFSVEVSMREAPPEAQARAASALSQPARALDLRLRSRKGGELSYGPRVQWPFLLMLYRRLSGDCMNVHFEADAGGGSRVTISGAVAKSKQPLAADADYWTEALGP
jgi:hypothetical protein